MHGATYDEVADRLDAKYDSVHTHELEDGQVPVPRPRLDDRDLDDAGDDRQPEVRVVP